MSALTRLNALRDAMRSRNLDALVVHHNANLRWLTDFSGIFDEEEAHVAVITDKTAVLHTDSRYATAFRARAKGTPFTVDSAPIAPSAFIVSALSDKPGARVGIEHDVLLNEYRAWQRALDAAYAGTQLIEMSGLIEDLRAVKDAGEKKKLAAAQKITDEAFAHLCAWMETGMTEREVAAELDHTMAKLGSDGLAFTTIVAAGKNGAMPHHLPDDTRIGRGDMVVMDFGARVDGYDSDMTRTVCFGKPSVEKQKVYDVVRAAHEAAAAAIKPGLTGAEAHAVAAGVIEEAGYGAYFGHALGHGVGIDIHEAPNLSPGNGKPLVYGNVVTVEPGIYLPGKFGVRLECFGAVTKTGFSPFTASSHDLIIIR